MGKRKPLIAARVVAKANKVLTAMDKRLDKIYTVAKVTPKNKRIKAEIEKLEQDIVRLYNGMKSKVASVEDLSRMTPQAAETLENLAILATKLDLLKSAIAEDMPEEDDDAPVSVDDVLSELNEGEDNGDAGEDNGDAGEDLDNDGIPDVDEPHGKLPEDFEGDHEDAMELAEGEEEGEEADDVPVVDDEEDDNEDIFTQTQTASKVKTARKTVATRRVVKKTLPSDGVSGLFNFIAGGK